jgi:hypothetical protein
MPKTANPTDLDLRDFLQAAGMLENPLSDQQKLIDLVTAASAGVSEFERRTGYKPFLASSTPETRTYQGDRVNTFPDGHYLDLGTGLISASSVLVNDNPQTVTTHYALEPAGANHNGKPYTDLRFLYGGYGYYQTISITGIFGYGLEIPDDAWLAMLELGALHAMRVSGSKLSKGAVEVRQGEVTRKYGEKGAFSAEKSEFEAHTKEVVGGYRRRVVY